MKHNRKPELPGAIILVLIVVFAISCSGSPLVVGTAEKDEQPPAQQQQTEPPQTQNEIPEQPVSPRESLQNPPTDYEFSLDVLADTYNYGGSATGYELEPYEYLGLDPDIVQRCYGKGVIAVDVEVKGANGIKAFYCDLEFENDRLTLIHIMFHDQFLGLPYNTVYHDEVDTLNYFQVMVNPDQSTGLSGDNLLATFYFIEDPAYALDYYPQASVPTREDGRSATEFNATTDTLTWYYYNVGDYNQDGIVEWADFAMICEYYGMQSNDINSIENVIAFTTGTAVDLLSVTNIGMHRNTIVESYNVYAGAGASYPDGGTLLGSVDFDDFLGNPETERIYFTFEVTDPQQDDKYWVKPVYDSVEGIAGYIAP